MPACYRQVDLEVVWWWCGAAMVVWGGGGAGSGGGVCTDEESHTRASERKDRVERRVGGEGNMCLLVLGTTFSPL